MSRAFFCCHILIAIVLALLATINALALDPNRAITQYVHRVWQTKDGLPVNAVRMMTQSPDGYLWLATSEGAVRFDGVRFETFSVKNQPALKSNDFFPMFTAKDGSVWAGSVVAGAARFKNGQVETLTKADGLAGDEVYSIYQSQDGSLWFSIRKEGISRYKDGKFTHYKDEDLLANIVWQFAETADGSVWAAGNRGTLFRFQNEQWTKYGSSDGLTIAGLTSLAVDKSDRLWIGGSKGLNVWENGKFSDFTPQIDLKGAPVYFILPDRDGSLWLATAGQGVVRYHNGKTAKFTAAEGLSSDSVTSLFEDREGSIWISCESGGLNQLYDGAITPYTVNEGLASNQISSVLQAKNGDLLFATNNGFSRLRDGVITNLGEKEGLSGKLAQSLWETRDGALWIATPTHGLNRLYEGQIKVFNEKDSIPRGYTRAILETGNNDLWIGMERGLIRWRGAEKTLFTTQNGLVDEVIRVLHETPTGDLWIGTQSGLQKFDGSNFQTLTTQNGLPSNLVTSIHTDAEGFTWVGTYGGLARIDKNGEIKSFTTRDGLYHNTVTSILFDDSGNLWMSCVRGIFRVQKSQLEQFARGEIKTIESFIYNTADGMKSAEVGADSQPAAWRANDGKLWYATYGGAVVIDPHNLRENSTLPNVLLEQILFDDKELLPSEKLDVPAGTRRVDFRFTAPSFRTPEKMKFQYQLVGYDKDWHDSENGKRQISYTNLPPGNYTFRVKTANENSVWNETGASLAMYVAPRFYQTWWFYALCAFGAIGTGFLIYSLRLRQMRQRFALVLEERTRIAREIHDTLAQNFLATSLQLEAAEETLNGDGNPNLKKHLSQARTLAREGLKEARNSISSLRHQKTIEEKNLVIDLERFAYQAVAATNINLRFKVNGKVRKYSELIEHNFFRIGQEAITNAVKHASAQNITVELNFNPQNLHLRVADDGRGFDKQTDAEKPVTNGSGGSYGLVGLKERAKIIGAQFEVESEKGKGTTVSAVIKNNNAGK